MTTFASFAFGCRVNEAEKLKFNRELIDTGFIYNEDKPDIYIINSCAVTQKAEREVRQFIYQTRKKFPKTKIIVTGCSATLWLKNKNLIKEADLFIDNQDKEQLINKFKDYINCHSLAYPRRQEKGNLKLIKDPHFRGDDECSFPDKFLDSGRLLVKIQNGCHRHCSYCIVPYLRGKPKSKTIPQIIQEIGQYSGIQEVILSAINTEAYGIDTGETLISLISAVISKTQIPRISLGSLHPWSLTNDFLKFYKNILPSNRLVSLFHIPLQSGSDNILKMMNRQYTTFQFIDKLEKIKKLNPNAFIGTDIITGFPGETEIEVKETYELLKKSPVDRFHVFRFSKRPGTVAEKLIKLHHLPNSEEVKLRSKKLINLSNKKYQQFTKSLIGKTDSVLILNQKTGDYQTGLLSNNVLIKFKSFNMKSGQIYKVKITKIVNHELFGQII